MNKHIILIFLLLVLIIFILKNKKYILKISSIKAREVLTPSIQIQQCKDLYQKNCIINDKIIFDAAASIYTNRDLKFQFTYDQDNLHNIKYVEPNIYDIGFSYYDKQKFRTDWSTFTGIFDVSGYDTVRFTYKCDNNVYSCISFGELGSGTSLTSNGSFPRLCSLGISNYQFYSNTIINFYEFKTSGNVNKIKSNFTIDNRTSSFATGTTLGLTIVRGQNFVYFNYFFIYFGPNITNSQYTTNITINSMFKFLNNNKVLKISPYLRII